MFHKYLIISLLLIPSLARAQDGANPNAGIALGGSGGGGGAGGSAPLTGTNATITVNTPLIDISQTWNAGAVVFTGIKSNITSTASAAGSLFLDLQLAGASQFRVTKAGVVQSGTTLSTGKYSFGPSSSTTTDLVSGANGELQVLSSFNNTQSTSLRLGGANAQGVHIVVPAGGSPNDIRMRAGDDTQLGMEIWRVILADPGGVANSGFLFGGTNPIVNNTNPTFASGFGTSPARTTGAGGTLSFRWNVGTGGIATAGVITMPTADNGWNCYVSNLTAKAANRTDDTVQTASTVTSISVQNQTVSTGAAVAWAASDILTLICAAF